eukprot:m.69536 g.69536  ORF g.69536 m.69536 type:complete len:114 (+) comp50074_c0_seq1:2865-3206(+)
MRGLPEHRLLEECLRSSQFNFSACASAREAKETRETLVKTRASFQMRYVNDWIDTTTMSLWDCRNCVVLMIVTAGVLAYLVFARQSAWVLLSLALLQAAILLFIISKSALSDS